MIIVASLSGLVSYTQSRESAKVGINTTTPQATMEVQVGASNLTGTTNEGIIAPRLSKERIANIENPVEGTLLYAIRIMYMLLQWRMLPLVSVWRILQKKDITSITEASG